MKNQNCGCENGVVFVYFKNEGRHGIRCDCYDCPVCKSGSVSDTVAQSGEEQISVDEYSLLNKQNWGSLMV